MRGMRHSGRFLATAMPVDVVESYSPGATEKQVDQDVEKVVLEHCELVNDREGNPADGGDTREEEETGRDGDDFLFAPLLTLHQSSMSSALDMTRGHRQIR
jgi:hypothetical protein